MSRTPEEQVKSLQQIEELENSMLSPVPLKILLLEAARKPNLVVGKFPKTGIDLGEFGRESERLIKLSLLDPDHFEYYNATCIDGDGRLLMLCEPIRGRQPGEVNIPLSFFNGKRLLLHEHSHGDIDNPLSMGDLETLFVNPELPKATSGILLATLTTKMLAFRTEQTPVFANTDYLVMDFQKHPALEEEDEMQMRVYDKSVAMERAGPYKYVPMTPEVKQGLAQLSHKRMFALSRVAQEFYLDIFACPLDKNIAYTAY